MTSFFGGHFLFLEGMFMINIKENEQLSILNHSTAHLLAQAIKSLYPHAKFWVGPVIEEGFYYDIDLGDDVISESQFNKIEKVMKKYASQANDIVRCELSKEEALIKFGNDPYKVDLISRMDEDNQVISCYSQGDFVDLCKGPHVANTKELKYFKLLKVSGAYWKGDANNKMLQRIYGVAFNTKEELDTHLYQLEEAKKRDHKKLGRELELFMFSEYGPGFPFWLDNGMKLRHKLEQFWIEEHRKEGYEIISTPMMLNKDLWEVSGHWFNYKENMYLSNIDENEFAIKPMNCPGGILVYKNSLHSYRQLPLRIGELGLVHRHEASGALNGLFRVRCFTQDDAHIFMTLDQIESEVVRLIAFIDRVYRLFNLTYTIELSTRPESKYIGSIEVWDKSEKALADACKAAGKDFKVNPGDGAFYGPKLDFHIRDSLNRQWQCGTIQLDLNLPQRFDLHYIDANNEKQRPVMLHRVIFGSVERFIGNLIEHFGGAFPLWLHFNQVTVCPVSSEVHGDYAKVVYQRLVDNNILVTYDDRNEKLGYKLRESQMKKTPYTLVVGDNEMANNSVTVRKYGQTETVTMSLDEFIDFVNKKIENKEIDY